jgi:hypothetical protein
MRLHEVVKRWSNFSCSSGPTNGSPHSAAKSRSFSKALAFAAELAYGQTLLNLPVASGIRVKGIKDLKQFREFVLSALLAGVLVVLPIYLATLLLLKAMKSLAGFVRPFTRLLPERFPAEQVLSFLLVVIFLLSRWHRCPNPNRPCGEGQNREFTVSENPWLYTVSNYDQPIGGREPGKHLEARLG